MSQMTNPDATDIREDLAAFRDRSLVEQLLVALITVIGIGLTAVTIYFAWERPVVRAKFAVGFFGAGVALYYLNEARKDIETPVEEANRSRLTARLSDGHYRIVRRLDAVVSVVFAIAAGAVGYHVYTNYIRLSREAIVFGFEIIDLYVGLIVIVLTIDATRRAYGWSIALVAVASVAYAYYGPAMPGFLQHPGFNLTDVSTFGAVRISGAFSFIMEVGATWVAIFIMFAGIARVYGALDFILGVGQKFGNMVRSGVVHVAVISSMIMGSITGSAAANTATTGSFTIPMMQRQGVRDDFAAAIESVASSGGQIMPPVMGVAAFLMADIIQVAYVDVIKSAAIPALLFYFSVGIAVQVAVMRYGWTTERTSDTGPLEVMFSKRALVNVLYFVALIGAFVGANELLGQSLIGSAAITAVTLLVIRFLQSALVGEDERTTFREFFDAVTNFFDGAHFGIPMAVLIYTLVVLEFSPMSAGLYTTLTMIGTMVVRDQLVDVLERKDASGGAAGSAKSLAGTFGRTLYNTLLGFRRGALDMAPLVGVLAAMGIIIAMVTETGLTGKISTQMVALGGGILVVVLFLAMVTSILFGLGMPTPAAYILVATLLAPPIVNLGVTDITAHLFVFYFAMLSAITPPVAVAVAVGSRIANAGFMTASKQALRIGAVGFLVPYAFVTNPSIITWSFPETVIALPVLLVAVTGITVATIGYDGKRVLSLPQRFGYLTLSLLGMWAPGLARFVGGMTAELIQVGAAVLILVALAVTNYRRETQIGTPSTDIEE
jgi:TRAP transporter 4TM/12TM fusion protein